MVKTLASSYSLPPNPEWISFPRTDANSSRWPKNNSRVILQDGTVNYFELLPIDHGQVVKWRIQVGAAVAERLGYVGFATKTYVIKDWPAGYQFYDHMKGPAAAPRHDPYLIGSVTVARFRSPSEFIPHAIWLISDGVNRANCECKYCAKRPQREVTDAFGLTQSARMRSTPSVTSAKRANEKRERRLREPVRIYAIVHKPLKPFKMPRGPQQFVVPNRENDLKASYCSRGMKRKRLAREGELVWAALEFPITMGNDSAPDSSILFWPALVKEVRLKTDIKPRPNGILRDNSNMDVDATDASHRSGNSKKANDEDIDPWIVEHSTVYKVMLLAVSQFHIVQDNQILPYQAYAPADALLESLQHMPIDLEQIASELPVTEDDNTFTNPDEITVEQRAFDRIAQFQPFTPDDVLNQDDQEYMQRKLVDAARAYCIAIQIGSKLANYWTPTDEYDYRIAPSSSDKVALDGSVPPAAVETGRRGDSDIANSLDGPYQVRFQGLWWGAERIWVDELVRLKLGRHQFSPRAGFIKPPSKSSLETERFIKETDLRALVKEEGSVGEGSEDGGDTLDVMGAASRGLFMRIDGIIMDGPSTDRSTPRGLKLCGMIYELADESAANSDDESKGASPTANGSVKLDIKGKGKERPSDSTGPPGSGSPNHTVDVRAIPPALARRMSTFPRTHPDGTILTYDEAAALSTPRKTSLPLPVAPIGYRFRPILHAGYEAVVDITLLSGRYYPRVLENPLMLPFVTPARARLGSPENHALWALEGLQAGVHNAVDPTEWRPSRIAMVKAADVVAKKELARFWYSKMEERKTMRDGDDFRTPNGPEVGTVIQDGEDGEVQMQVDS